MLMTLINAHPAVKRWFIDALRVTDLHDGAPSVKQLHENPVTATTSVAKYLEGDFNNPAAYPDAVLSIDGQQIHVHKRVVAKACKVRSNPKPKQRQHHHIVTLSTIGVFVELVVWLGPGSS